MGAPLDRWARAVVVLVLLAIASGAFATSNRIAFGQSKGVGFHTGLSIVAVLCAIALCLMASRQLASWLVLSSIALAGLTGWPSVHAVWHAIFAHLSLGLATAAM